MDPDAPQREHNRREVFNVLRWLVRAGAPWRMLPNTSRPWRRFTSRRSAGCVLRLAVGRDADPTAVIFDARTLQSSPERGGRGGYDGYKRKRGSKLHLAVDTLGHLLALHVTPANEQERAQVGTLAVAVQEATGQHVEVAALPTTC